MSIRQINHELIQVDGHNQKYIYAYGDRNGHLHGDGYGSYGYINGGGYGCGNGYIYDWGWGKGDGCGNGNEIMYWNADDYEFLGKKIPENGNGCGCPDNYDYTYIPKNMKLNIIVIPNKGQ